MISVVNNVEIRALAGMWTRWPTHALGSLTGRQTGARRLHLLKLASSRKETNTDIGVRSDQLQYKSYYQAPRHCRSLLMASYETQTTFKAKLASTEKRETVYCLVNEYVRSVAMLRVDTAYSKAWWLRYPVVREV